MHSTSSSEGVALGAAFKLMDLGAVPRWPWEKFELGRIRVISRASDSEVRQRNVSIRWRTHSVTMTLQKKFVGLDSSLRKEGTLHGEGTNGWNVATLEVAKFPTSVPGAKFPRIVLEDEGSVHFFLYDLLSTQHSHS